MKKAIVPILVSIILAITIVLVANIASDTALNLQKKGFLRVKGFAKQAITSDMGFLEATITTESSNLKTCYKKLAEDREKVKKFLKEKYSVTDKEYELRHACIRNIYKRNAKGHTTTKLDKYILTQDLRVESPDVHKITKVASGLIDILGEGVKITIQRPEYIYTKLDDLKVEMIGRASTNARERVKAVTQKGKVRLGPIAAVRVGIFQITPAYSTAISDYGINDTTTIEKEIKSVVEIKYFVR
ncbi:MAG: SIMPL domain-containing protein [Candidatus Omnitrophica bacterium]|nr:SIMPL domain-containing protein [Candidatus Omnitrophota bacterium]